VVVCWGGKRRGENGDGWWGGKHCASLPWRLAQEKNQGEKDGGERTECFRSAYNVRIISTTNMTFQKSQIIILTKMILFIKVSCSKW
jgi:hypothetical protein